MESNQCDDKNCSLCGNRSTGNNHGLLELEDGKFLCTKCYEKMPEKEKHFFHDRLKTEDGTISQYNIDILLGCINEVDPNKEKRRHSLPIEYSIMRGKEAAKWVRSDSMETAQSNAPWLDGYDLEKLNELYAIGEPIKEATAEQYRPYFEFANSEYYNFQVLEKHKDSIKELLVSNFGSVKYNGVIIPSTLVRDGPNKGIYGGKIDHYREILFPGLPIKRYVFKTYRLVAEVWCCNPDPKIYTTVHHIGDDSFDNKSNLLFVTQEQHEEIRHVWDLATPRGKKRFIEWAKTL